MLIQSLFFTIFSLVLTALFAAEAMSAVHTLEITHEQRIMLAEADAAVQSMRASAQTTMQAVSTQPNTLPLLSPPPDSNGRVGHFTVHTAIDTVLPDDQTISSGAQGCDVHDAMHQCNLSIGSGLAEQRIWITIDIKSNLTSGERLSMRRHVLLRLLRARPYASVVAIRDDGTGGGKSLGDPSGVPANAADAAAAGSGTAATFHDTRIHVYEPCRMVPASNAAMATDKRVWANWQGGRTLAGRQNTCENDAGETTQYINSVQSTTQRTESSWGH